MTLLLPVAASLCPAVPRPVLPCPVISTEHFWETISQRGDRERNTYTQRREYEDNGRFNAVSHKHALIRAEGWCSCCGVQIKMERGRDGEAGGPMIPTLCSGQVASSAKSSSVISTTETNTHARTHNSSNSKHQQQQHQLISS